MEVSSSATVGRSIVESEFVKAEGNKMQGSAIPVSTPYVWRDSVVENPNLNKYNGIEIDSTPCNMLIDTLLEVNGIEWRSKSLALCWKCMRKEAVSFWLSCRYWQMQNAQAQISPATSP